MRRSTSQLTAFTLVELMIVVALIAMLGAIAVPNIIKSRDFSRTNACVNNLRQIDNAKEQWALENGVKLGVAPGDVDLQPYFGRGNKGTLANVHCPLVAQGPLAGYSVNAIGVLPKCDQYGGVHVPGL